MAFNLEMREALWNSQVMDVFSAAPVTIGDDDDFTTCTNDLITAHKLMKRLWWNVKSLEEYLKMAMFPRGLRIQIFPAWELDAEFKKTWETGLAQCSKILISLMIEHDRGLLLKTKLQIQLLEANLAKFDTETHVLPFQKRLRELLEKYEKEIMLNKKKEVHKGQK